MKSGERYPILVSKCGVPSQMRDVRNDIVTVLHAWISKYLEKQIITGLKI